MSAYQIAVRSTVVRTISLGRLYERFLDWWVSLYAKPPSHLTGRLI
ncbi:MAG: hypothetical protein ACREVB_13165 [Burkholderiales bacterium]